jgi:hypothetical protein
MKNVQCLEAITVCVGYSDFLEEIIPFNIPHFDRWVIVTSDDDISTRELCRKHNLEVLISRDHKLDGASFNKGRLIERALLQTSNNSWRLHIDGDVALPSRFRLQLESANLDPSFIYGIDRVMVRNYSEWQKVKSMGFLSQQADYHCRVNTPPGFQIGTRWAHPVFGYVPIGFFQLFHASQDEWRGVRVKPYSLSHGDACRSDVQFGMKWDRNHRALLPEIIAVHLESEKCDKGANWNGRRTAPFKPTRPGSC